jgi:hypothetical protein
VSRRSAFCCLDGENRPEPKPEVHSASLRRRRNWSVRPAVEKSRAANTSGDTAVAACDKQRKCSPTREPWLRLLMISHGPMRHFREERVRGLATPSAGVASALPVSPRSWPSAVRHDPASLVCAHQDPDFSLPFIVFARASTCAVWRGPRWWRGPTVITRELIARAAARSRARAKDRCSVVGRWLAHFRSSAARSPRWKPRALCRTASEVRSRNRSADGFCGWRERLRSIVASTSLRVIGRASASGRRSAISPAPRRPT